MRCQIVEPPDQREKIAARVTEWTDALKPTDAIQRWLVTRAATASVRLDRCVERENLALEANTAIAERDLPPTPPRLGPPHRPEARNRARQGLRPPHVLRLRLRLADRPPRRPRRRPRNPRRLLVPRRVPPRRRPLRPRPAPHPPRPSARLGALPGLPRRRQGPRSHRRRFLPRNRHERPRPRRPRSPTTATASATATPAAAPCSFLIRHEQDRLRDLRENLWEDHDAPALEQALRPGAHVRRLSRSVPGPPLRVGQRPRTAPQPQRLPPRPSRGRVARGRGAERTSQWARLRRNPRPTFNFGERLRRVPGVSGPPGGRRGERRERGSGVSRERRGGPREEKKAGRKRPRGVENGPTPANGLTDPTRFVLLRPFAQARFFSKAAP